MQSCVFHTVRKGGQVPVLQGLCQDVVGAACSLQPGVSVALSPSRGCPHDCSKSTCPLLSPAVSVL